MGVEIEVAEKTFKIPRGGLAVLAVIVGVLIIAFPPLLAYLVAVFMIAWGVLEGVQIYGKPTSRRETS